MVACGTRAQALRTIERLQAVADAVRSKGGRDLRIVSVLSARDMPSDRHVNEAWRASALVYSPSVSAGVSFSVRGWFQRCYLFLTGGFHGLPGVRNQVQMIARVRDVPEYHIFVQPPMRLRFRDPDTYGLERRHAPPSAEVMMGDPRNAVAPKRLRRGASRDDRVMELARALVRGVDWKYRVGEAEKHYSYERSFLHHLGEMGVNVSRELRGSADRRGVEVKAARERREPHPLHAPPATWLRARVWQQNLPQPILLQKTGILPIEAGWCEVGPPTEARCRAIVQETPDPVFVDALHAAVLQAILMREYLKMPWTKAHSGVPVLLDLALERYHIQRACRNGNRMLAGWVVR